MTLRGLTLVLMLAFAPVAALAVQPDEILDDPVLEERAREISAGLRCLVCQNQSIDDSDADLARDLRLIVRERLQEGDSNEEVVDFVTQRYGAYVLLKPPVTMETIALWASPVLVLGIGLVAIFFWFRGRRQDRAKGDVPSAALSAEEEARLKAILDEDK